MVGGLIGAMFGREGFHPFVLFPIFLVVLILIAVSGGVRRMTRPMNSLIDAAQRIESGDYSAQVPEWGSRDIRSVARAFNSMSARLKTIDEQRRSFMADVTHELRTPLSVIRGQAEAIADGVYPADAAHLAPILDATQALDRLVEDLRTLVLTDAGNLALNKEPTDLAQLVEDTVGSFRSQAESAGVSLTTEDPPGDQQPAVERNPAHTFRRFSKSRGHLGKRSGHADRHRHRRRNRAGAVASCIRTIR
jgi:signal transduction histidine kinase